VPFEEAIASAVESVGNTDLIETRGMYLTMDEKEHRTREEAYAVTAGK